MIRNDLLALLAGGRLKEPLSLAGETLAGAGVAKACLFGECGPDMARAWSASLPTVLCGTLERAVEEAARATADLAAGSVLLAPGTASFDQFRSFEDRGRAFAAAFAASSRFVN